MLSLTVFSSLDPVIYVSNSLAQSSPHPFNHMLLDSFSATSIKTISHAEMAQMKADEAWLLSIMYGIVVKVRCFAASYKGLEQNDSKVCVSSIPFFYFLLRHMSCNN